MKSGIELLTDLFAGVPDPGEEVGKAGGRISDNAELIAGLQSRRDFVLPNVDPALALKEIAAVTALSTTLKHFMGGTQLKLVRDFFHGEEREFFFDKVLELARVVDDMPHSYQSQGGDNTIVHLHYFTGGCDWYITEKDKTPGQNQAFGLCCMHEDELGYVSLPEITAENAELDFYWKPKTLEEVRAERAPKVDPVEPSDADIHDESVMAESIRAAGVYDDEGETSMRRVMLVARDRSLADVLDALSMTKEKIGGYFHVTKDGQTICREGEVEGIWRELVAQGFIQWENP